MFAYVVSCFALVAGAQDFTTSYKPLGSYRPAKLLVKSIGDSYDISIKTLSEHKSSEVKKEIKKSITELRKDFIQLDSLHQIMDSDNLTAYMRGIVKRIQEKNPSIADRKFKLFTYRTLVPNASSHGGGLLLINLDMIQKLSSEAQLAFVIGHEIGHDVLNHVMDGIVKRAQYLDDMDFKQELKRLKYLTYNSNKEIENLYLRVMARFGEHSRENETQADSISLMLCHNAGYSAYASVISVGKLDSLDEPLYSDSIAFHANFDFKECAFKREWLKAEDNDLGGNLDSIYKIPDSLKTHPDCKLRADNLRALIRAKKFSDDSLAPDTASGYDPFRKIAQFEAVETSMNGSYYSQALFDALQLRTHFPENLYLKCAISNSLFELYEAEKNHRFSEVCDFPNKEFSKEYRELLVFLHNISLASLKKVCIVYYNNNISDHVEYEFASYLGLVVRGSDMGQEDFQASISNFIAKNKNSRYSKLLESKKKEKEPSKPKHK